MVEVIQRYGLSASRGAGSLNLSADNAGLPVHRGAKPNPHHPRPIFLQKIILRQKPETMRIASVFSPIFRLTGRALEGAVIVVTVECLLWESVMTGCW